MFLSLLLAAVLRGLHPPLMCQNYLVDRTRRALEIARSLADFLLSNNCATSLLQRTTSAARVLAACTPFLHEESGAQVVVDGIRSRFLFYRLKGNVRLGWEGLDLALHESFNIQHTITSPKADVISVVDLLLRQQINETLKVQLVIQRRQHMLMNIYIRTHPSCISHNAFLDKT